MDRDIDDVGGIDPDDSPQSQGADSPAPVPPHERPWRHPSEIGLATITAIDGRPLDIGRTGRGLVGFISVSGTLLAIVLVMSLQPSPPHSNHHDLVALTNSQLQIASFEYPEQLIDPKNPQPGTASDRPPTEDEPSNDGVQSSPYSNRITSLLAESDVLQAMGPVRPHATTTEVEIRPSNPVTTLHAMGVLSKSGEHLLTTLAAVNGIESIDVRLPNGKTVRAKILHTLNDLNIAVLSISDEQTTGAHADIRASGLGIQSIDFALGQPVLVLGDSPRELVIGEQLSDVVVALHTFASATWNPATIAEGAPLVSKTGHLIGLCTHLGDQLGFVPTNALEEALAQLLSADAASTSR